MKRALLAVLILANLGVFAWVHWYVLPGRSEPGPSAAPGGQPLQLMSELSPAQRKLLPSTAAPAASTKTTFSSTTIPAGSTFASATVLTSAPAAGTGPALVCASYGPFPSSDAVTQAIARLKTAGVTANQHLIPGKAKLGYWVYLPPFGSRKEADSAADLLKKKGVTDIYVVADEANRNAVSLGVFSQRDGASQREKDIKKLGFRAQVAERFREEPRYWLDVHGSAATMPTADSMKDLGDESAPVGMATAPCAG